LKPVQAVRNLIPPLIKITADARERPTERLDAVENSHLELANLLSWACF